MSIKNAYPRLGNFAEEQHHGLPCVVVRTDMGHCCGYVGVKVGHPLHGTDYVECPEFNVWCGLTYSDMDSDGTWWIGWDDAHWIKLPGGDHMGHTADLARQISELSP